MFNLPFDAPSIMANPNPPSPNPAGGLPSSSPQHPINPQTPALRPSSTDPCRTDARCPACGTLAPIVWVHGHGQCAACKTNIAPCCQP